ncbi:MAG: LPS export ABC transporter periplasmic protein LptC [Atribacterota bacterium]|jgi:LPS export ABC transporter protein LptC|nr:LPS export ABC transporter periplasmic protein LptC [Atribacterota bacterium]MDD4895482.1 LPS export ABC transporter periplasmic protein LptC [Atribacterota bacterium]MDD5637865.1 LPS export ABC transporter periplasmic protein LptC [Atribacterota bacterium]
MKNIKLYLIIAVVLIIGIHLFYNFYYNTPPEETISPEEAIDQVEDDIIIHEPPVRIGEGQVLGIKDEKKEWLIEADTISIGEDRESTLFENIKQMTIFKDEEPHLNISAQKCIANMQSKDMELNGDVVISKEDGDSLRGEKVFWHSEEQRLSSNEQVELKVDDNYIIAGGFSTNMEMTQLELFNRVTVTMKL